VGGVKTSCAFLGILYKFKESLIASANVIMFLRKSARLRKMWKKQSKLIAAIAIVIIIVVGIVVVWYVTRPPPAPRKVTWSVIAGFYTDAMNKIAKDFTEKTGIQVEVIGIDNTVLYEKEVMELAAKTGAYDVVTIETMWMSEWSLAHYLEPLDEYIAKTPKEEINFEDILPHYRVLLSRGTHTYGLPYYTFDQGSIFRADLYERKDIQDLYFNTYGRALRKPDHTMTWEEYYDICKFFSKVVPQEWVTQPGKTFYGLSMMAGRFGESQDEFMALLWGHGMDWVDKDYNIIINNDLGVKCMQQYVDFLALAAPNSIEITYDGCVGNLRSGICQGFLQFFLDQWPNAIKTEQEVPGAKMGIGTPVGGRGYTGVFAVGMSADSKHKADAWEWIKYLSGAKAQKDFALMGGSTCRRSVLYDPEFYSTPELAHKYAHLKAIADSAALLETLPDWEKPPRIFMLPQSAKIYVGPFIDVMSLLANHQKTAKEAADLMADEIAKISGWYPEHKPPAGWTPGFEKLSLPVFKEQYLSWLFQPLCLVGAMLPSLKRPD